MEVHHPHAHVPKKFKEYILEFFMLFFAVTLGFLAENLREHMAESKKEREYIISLTDDLKKDTADIREVKNALLKAIHREDTLIYLLQHYQQTDSTNKKLYRFYTISAANVLYVRFNQNAINQLMNTGSMRLIGRSHMLDSVMEYVGLVRAVEAQAEYYKQAFNRAFDFSSSIFDLSYIHIQISDSFKISPAIHFDTAHFGLVTYAPKVFQRYAAYLIMQQNLSTSYLLALRYTEANAVRLIAVLKKEYAIAE